MEVSKARLSNSATSGTSFSVECLPVFSFIWPKVTYWADQSGFHAEVSSNEPGLGTDENGNSPADVTLNLQPPPAGM